VEVSEGAGEVTQAAFNRGKSRQDIETPPEFFAAVERRFGRTAIDLAAHERNHKCAEWFGHGGLCDDALSADWSSLTGNAWCNPPFTLIAKFVAKMAVECRNRPAWTLLLTPASPGSNWGKLCEENGFVITLEDRMKFVGESSNYPKDLQLTAFGFGVVGRARWHWDERVTKAYDRNRK
jgi:phage N-6-adenine-methyltransferase